MKVTLINLTSRISRALSFAVCLCYFAVYGSGIPQARAGNDAAALKLQFRAELKDRIDDILKPEADPETKLAKGAFSLQITDGKKKIKLTSLNSAVTYFEQIANGSKKLTTSSLKITMSPKAKSELKQHFIQEYLSQLDTWLDKYMFNMLIDKWDNNYAEMYGMEYYDDMMEASMLAVEEMIAEADAMMANIQAEIDSMMYNNAVGFEQLLAIGVTMGVIMGAMAMGTGIAIGAAISWYFSDDDGDGVINGKDKYPNDPNKSIIGAPMDDPWLNIQINGVDSSDTIETFAETINPIVTQTLLNIDTIMAAHF